MRSRLKRLAAVAVVVGLGVTVWLRWGGTVAQESNGQPPSRQHPIISDWSPPPSDLRSMVDSAEAVALVRMERQRPAEKEISATESRRLVTIYTTTIVEIFKRINDLPGPGEELEVVREGGSVVRGGQVETLSEMGFPPFRIGGEYVLFMTKDPATGLLTPKWAADGAYAINEGRVESPGRSPAALLNAAKSSDSFLRELRSLKGF